MNLCHRGCYSHCEARVATHSVNRNLVSSMFPTQSLYKMENAWVMHVEEDIVVELELRF